MARPVEAAQEAVAGDLELTEALADFPLAVVAVAVEVMQDKAALALLVKLLSLGTKRNL
jgi:hypothetical protein